MTWVSRHDPLQLSTATLCWYHETESDLPVQSARLSDGELATVLDDLNHRSLGPEISEAECTRPGQVHFYIVGVNAWGDRLSLDGYCGAFDLSGSNSDVWRPAPETQAIFARLVSAQPLEIPSPTADTAPDGVLQAWADLLNNGLPERADQLWVDPAIADRPGDDIDHLQMKTEEGGRPRPRATPRHGSRWPCTAKCPKTAAGSTSTSARSRWSATAATNPGGSCRTSIRAQSRPAADASRSNPGTTPGSPRGKSR